MSDVKPLSDVRAGADAWSRGDYPGAVAQWQGPAAAGDPDAQFNLGQAYRLGRGVERDLARAEDLFGKAAAQGHVQAADNYGLLMFDRGARAAAMPYVRAASDRGDPRAQYLMGIAHFNGDLAPRDWVRAYALMTLAQGAGLPQAAPALQQMDGFIPLDQRQEAARLAPQIAQAADTARATQIAAGDLGGPPAQPLPLPLPLPQPTPPRPVAVPGQGAASAGADYARAGNVPPPGLPAAAFAPPPPRPAPAAPTASAHTAPGGSPATAGADYARAGNVPPPGLPAAAFAPPRPRPPVAAAPAQPAKPATAPAPAAKPPAVAAKPQPAPHAAASSPWRVQLGAFGVPANADALWAKVSGRPELAGHARINVKVGRVSKLQAGGFASQSAAAAACAALARSGHTCLPAQD
ncbi:SPOR domain-containing protein [Novosphingobium bradum]|uniref:SPOR domain-containing protein n=1 Tax=Novosphingobium bradum TaxID=1737444 RepID=A0ABV7IRM1_9SPHN